MHEMPSFDTSFLKQFTNVEYTFIGWLQAQLLEAEGLLHGDVSQGYYLAVTSLKQRLLIAGKAEKAVEYLDSYLDNIRRWSKIEYDINKILERPESVPIYTEEDCAYWTITVSPALHLHNPLLQPLTIQKPRDDLNRDTREHARTAVATGAMSVSEADQMMSEMNLAVKVYDSDGGVVTTAVPDRFLPKLLLDRDPGALFCDEYWQQYHHLYQ